MNTPSAPPLDDPRPANAGTRAEVAAVLADGPTQAFDPALAFPDTLGRIARRRQAALKAPPNTRKAWQGDWRWFARFVAEHAGGFRPADIPAADWRPIPAPPELVVAFVDYYSPATDDQLDLGAPLVKASTPRKPATVRRALATISKAHRIHGLEDPTKDEMVRDAVKAFCRHRGAQRQADPIHWDDIERVLALDWEAVKRFCASAPEPIADQVRTALRGPGQLRRVQALLAIGYNTLARREELAAFDVDDIKPGNAGDGTARIRRGKTDQEGKGHVRYLSPPAVAAYRAWLDAAGITEGPLFTQYQRNGQARLKDDRPVLNPKTGGTMKPKRPPKGQLPKLLPYGKRITHDVINRAFKAAMLAIGKSANDVAAISGHSTRVGAAQDLCKARVDLLGIMQSGGWKNAAMPKRYTEELAAEHSGMAAMMRAKLGGVPSTPGSVTQASPAPVSSIPESAPADAAEASPASGFLPEMPIAGQLTVGGVDVPIRGTAAAGDDGRLTVKLEPEPLSGDARLALDGAMGRPGQSTPWCALTATAPSGETLESEHVTVISLRTDDFSIALEEATVTLPMDTPVAEPRMRMWLRGVKNFGPIWADTPLGRVQLHAGYPGVQPDDVSGHVTLVAPTGGAAGAEAAWRCRAEAFMTFLRGGLALANGGRLQQPILKYHEGDRCAVTFNAGSGVPPMHKVQHPLNQRTYFEALAARFFDPAPWPDVLWIAQGWLHAHTTHDEVRFINAMTALEALIHALPKHKTKGKYLRDKLRILLEHHGVRHDDLLPHVPALVSERNTIVHRGEAVALTWELIIVVCEMVTRILLQALNYVGPYECYLDGDWQTRQFPACKAN